MNITILIGGGVAGSLVADEAVADMSTVAVRPRLRGTVGFVAADTAGGVAASQGRAGVQLT